MHVSGRVGIKVSDDQVLPVMTDLLVVLECLILSYLILSCFIFYAWSVSINHRVVPAQDVPAVQFNFIETR